MTSIFFYLWFKATKCAVNSDAITWNAVFAFAAPISNVVASSFNYIPKKFDFQFFTISHVIRTSWTQYCCVWMDYLRSLLCNTELHFARRTQPRVRTSA